MIKLNVNADFISIKVQVFRRTEFLKMPDVGFPLLAKMLSHEAPHLAALEEAFSWAHPDLLDNPELKEVSCLVECPSGSLSHAVDQLPLSFKFAGTEPMLGHFGLRVRRKDELD